MRLLKRLRPRRRLRRPRPKLRLPQSPLLRLPRPRSRLPKRALPRPSLLLLSRLPRMRNKAVTAVITCPRGRRIHVITVLRELRGKERMNKIFDNKQEFTELYRDAVMSISGKASRPPATSTALTPWPSSWPRRAPSPPRVTPAPPPRAKARVLLRSRGFDRPPARLPAQLWRARHGRQALDDMG